MAIQCAICKTTWESTQEAIDDGWVPEFYEDEDDAHGIGPACSKCAADCLEEDAGGELMQVWYPVFNEKSPGLIACYLRRDGK